MGMGTATVGFFYFYLHIASVIFTSFGTQMSAANLLFTCLLLVGTNILILHRGKQHPEERRACGSNILYAGSTSSLFFGVLLPPMYISTYKQ